MNYTSLSVGLKTTWDFISLLLERGLICFQYYILLPILNILLLILKLNMVKRSVYRYHVKDSGVQCVN